MEEYEEALAYEKLEDMRLRAVALSLGMHDIAKGITQRLTTGTYEKRVKFTLSYNRFIKRNAKSN